MSNQKKCKPVVNRKAFVVLRKKNPFHSALLFLILITMLVSACGGDTGTSGQAKTAQDWLDLGENYFLKNKYEQAIEAFQKVFDLEPNNIPARTGKAKAYIGLGMLDEAKGVLLQILELDSSNREATDLLASLSEAGPKTTESDKPGTDPAEPVEGEVNLFVNGLLAVKDDSGKWGYIDKTCEYVIKPLFIETRGFSANGLAATIQKFQWGYIDKTGHFVIEEQFNYAKSFTASGLAAVEVKGKWGYIDETGAFVIEPQFDHAKSFSANGLAAVEVDGKWGYIDKTGRIVIDPKFRQAYSFSADGPSPVHDDSTGKWGYIDETGAFAIDPQYVYARPFATNGLAAVMLFGQFDLLWGYINDADTFVLKPQFTTETEIFSVNGLTGVEVDGKWGYIDETGTFAIEPQFEAIRPFSPYLSCGLAGVSVDGKWGIIDEKGTFVVNPHYDNVASMCSTDGYLVVTKNGKWGVVDREGNEVIPCQFVRIGIPTKLLLSTVLRNKWEND